MRELPILDDKGICEDAAPITLGFMLFPDDEVRAKCFAVTSSAAALHRAMLSDEETFSVARECGFTEEPGYWRLLDYGKYAPAMLEDAEPRFIQADIAVAVLWRALQLHEHSPDKVSVNNAIRIVAHALAKGEREIRAAWGRFKPVAHLWMAAAELGTRREEHAISAMLSDFPAFLSMAEAVRRKASEVTARRSRAPLIPLEMAFAVPSTLALQDCAFRTPVPEHWIPSRLRAR